MGETDQIAALEERVARFERELARAKAELQQAKERKAGVCVGDVVTKDGQYFIVSKVQIWGSGKPWVTARPRKKNGEWSDNIRHLGCGWERPPVGGTDG